MKFFTWIVTLRLLHYTKMKNSTSCFNLFRVISQFSIEEIFMPLDIRFLAAD